MHRLRDADRLTAAPVRYVACHPGALLHVDYKKLGRVPIGGGHRVTGRAASPHHNHSGAGYEHLERPEATGSDKGHDVCAGGR